MRTGRGSPTTTATNVFYDLQKFFDCNNSHLDDNEGEEATDNDDDDDLSSVSTEHCGKTHPIGFNNSAEEISARDDWSNSTDVPHSTSKVESEEDAARIMACRCMSAQGTIAQFFDYNNSSLCLDDYESDEETYDGDNLSSASGKGHGETRDPIVLDTFPEVFRVHDNWPDTWSHLTEVPQPTSKVESEDDVARIMACRCINARGAIAHGKCPGLMYEAEDVSHCSVSEIFNSFGEGTKILKNVADIKNELMNCGPVVSTSFILSNSIASSPTMTDCFLSSQVSKTHPLLITGWRVTEFGEVWIVNHLDLSRQDHIIAFGHFHIDSECVAPKGNFENTRWQAGPYFDHDFSRVTEDWRQCHNLKIHLKSCDLERLDACFDTGVVSAVTLETHFELRDKHRRSHSRTCCLKEIGWDAERSKWRVIA